MLTLYLSSTLDDLRAYREKIKNTLAGFYVIKESYDAATGSVRESCLEDVEHCDVYIGIFALRYGWVPKDNNPEQRSITELEYRRAVEHDIPRLIFLLDEKNQPWLPRYDDRAQDPLGHGPRIQALRNELASVDSRPAFFTTEENLATQVLRAVQSEVDKRRRQEEQKKLQQARDSLPSMHPEARHPHPRQLTYAALLLHVAGTDEPQARLIESALPGSCRVRSLPLVPDDPPTIAAIDAALADCRSASLFLSHAGLGRLKPHAAEFAPLLDMMRARTQCLFALTAGVTAADLPAQWQLGQVFELDAWLADGSKSISGQLAGFLTGIKALCPDFDLPGLVGLPYTVLAMTAEEARRLRDSANTGAGYDEHHLRYFREITHTLGNSWIDRYGATRMDWKPFGDRTAVQLLKDVVRDINDQEFVPRRDQENLRGNKIRLRPYPFDPLFMRDYASQTLYRQMKRRGCLVLVDELSLVEPALRRAARSFLVDERIAVITVSPIDPALCPFEEALCDNSPIDLGSLLTRFRDNLDPQCELAVSSRARLRRWLRQSMPEALGGVEGEGAVPQLRAEFLKEVYPAGRA